MRGMLSAVLMPATLSVCATTRTPTAETSVLCNSMLLTTFSRKDTDETIAQIRADNAWKLAICPNLGAP